MHPEIVSLFDDRIRLSNWQPILEQETNIPTPETHYVELIPDEKADGLHGKYEPEEIIRIAESLGDDAFVRGDFKSSDLMNRVNLKWAKEKGNDLTRFVQSVIGETLSGIRMNGYRHGDILILREWLDLQFCTYWADTFHPEARFFIRDGEVTYWYPRMNKESFERKGIEGLYEEAVSELNRQEDQMWAYAEEAAEAFDGRWSIDFVLTTDRDLYCTDMAVDAIRWCPHRKEWLDVSAHEPGSKHSWMNTYADSIESPENIEAKRGEGPAPYHHSFEELYTGRTDEN